MMSLEFIKPPKKVSRREYVKSEEYRAKRRADYAAKHANDPMTEKRRQVLAGWERRRKRLQQEEQEQRDARLTAIKDMQAEEDAKAAQEQRLQQDVWQFIQEAHEIYSRTNSKLFTNNLQTIHEQPKKDTTMYRIIDSTGEALSKRFNTWTEAFNYRQMCNRYDWRIVQA